MHIYNCSQAEMSRFRRENQNTCKFTIKESAYFKIFVEQSLLCFVCIIQTLILYYRNKGYKTFSFHVHICIMFFFTPLLKLNRVPKLWHHKNLFLEFLNLNFIFRKSIKIMSKCWKPIEYVNYWLRYDHPNKYSSIGNHCYLALCHTWPLYTRSPTPSFI